jgi:maltooligosyltrehalose trehalohydrolase
MPLPQTAPSDRHEAENALLSGEPNSQDVKSSRLAPLGAQVTRAGTSFRVYATGVRRVQVRIVDAQQRTLSEHDLVAAKGDGATPPGDREVLVPDVGAGTLYQFVLDGKVVPDPFARELPFGVHGPARVVESRHSWQHGAGVARPLREHVIYEVHVGTFTPEGTYRAAAAHLPELVTLGVTAVELMPLAAFPGTAGWGYDGVALFAPHAPYGTPDELRAFIDQAHDLGLSVFLDVVYNHFGPAGNYLSAYSSDYFSSETKNAWGEAPDFSRPPMRRLLIDNALYWLREFRFDGLRLDATHAIIDRSPRHILRELADEVATLRPKKLLIAEDERNEPELVAGYGLDGVWADDFHHAVRVTLTGEQEGYYGAYAPGVATIAETIKKGWLFTGQTYTPTGSRRGKPCHGLRAESLIYCIQNHDQIGNRAFGDRLTESVSPEAYAVAATVLLFLPMTPLLFMGQEWGASTRFQYFTDHDPELGQLVSRGRREEFRGFSMFASPELSAQIPDPQAKETFQRSHLDWDERARAPHAQMLQLHRDLLALRAHDPVLAHADRDALEARAVGDVLLVRRWTPHGARLLLANFGTRPVALNDLGRGFSRRQIVFRSTSSTDGVATTLPGHTALILG